MAQPVHAGLLSSAASKAQGQFGVISWPELQELGVDGKTVWRWKQARLIHQIHPAVYAIGHDNLTVHGDWMAAQLWGGLLTHVTAAMALGLQPKEAGRVHVTVPPTSSARSRKLHVHRSAVPDSQIVQVGPFIATNSARTILDIAETDRRPWRLQALLDKAIELEVYDEDEMDDVIATCAGRRGLRHLRPVLADLRDSTLTFRSLTERRICHQLGRLGLPAALVNHVIRRSDGPDIELDLFWPAALLCVELDGPQHDLPFQRARDERRDAWLLAERRINTLRYPVRSVTAEAIVAEVAPILRAAA